MNGHFAAVLLGQALCLARYSSLFCRTAFSGVTRWWLLELGLVELHPCLLSAQNLTF